MIQDDKLPLKLKFLKYYEELPIQGLAGAHVGRSDDTITNWKKEDSDFSDKILEADAKWALKNYKGVRSKEWVLERVMRKHFAPSQNINISNVKEALDKLDTDPYDTIGQEATKQMVENQPPLQNQE